MNAIKVMRSCIKKTDWMSIFAPILSSTADNHLFRVARCIPYVICHKRLSIVSIHLKHIPKQNISRSKKNYRNCSSYSRVKSKSGLYHKKKKLYDDFYLNKEIVAAITSVCPM